MITNMANVRGQCEERKMTSTAAIAATAATAATTHQVANTTAVAVAPILVCVRKRPVFDHERRRGEIDAIGCNADAASRPTHGHDHGHDHRGKVTAFRHKTKLDGITAVVEPVPFRFDCAFDQRHGNDAVYEQAMARQVAGLLDGHFRTVTAFAYGQTGSGKTYTMQGLTQYVAAHLFAAMRDGRGRGIAPVVNADGSARQPQVTVSMFELLGNAASDLLHRKEPVHIREDVDGNVHVRGLTNVNVTSAAHLLETVEVGAALRAQASTQRNATSSRTHAVCRITIRCPKPVAVVSAERARAERIHSKRVLGTRAGAFRPPPDCVLRHITLVDLAGSERNRDSAAHDAARRKECTEINKSLMCLKECIRFRAMPKATHVPYRGSRLTLFLKDCFEKEAEAAHRTVVVANVSPLASDHHHSVNTLRYADRIKERAVAQASSGRAVRINNPERWSKKKVAAWLASECCDVAADSWGNVTGKMLCRMTQTEMSYRCSRHAPHLYAEVHRLRQAAKAMMRKAKQR